MAEIDDVTAWLLGRTDEALAALVGEWTPYGAPPRSMRQFAQQLLNVHSVGASIKLLTQPEQQLLVAACALATPVERPRSAYYGHPPLLTVSLPELLARVGAVGPGERRDAALAMLDRHRSRLFLLPVGVPAKPDQVRVPEPIYRVFHRVQHHPRPLDQALNSAYTMVEMRRIADALGIKAATRTAAQQQIVALLSDPAAVRALLAEAPERAREIIDQMVPSRKVLATYCFEADRGKYRFRVGGSGDAGTDWLAERALLVPLAPERADVPREVVAAIAGEDSLADPFDPEPPVPTCAPVPVERVHGQAQAAMSTAIGRIENLLAALAVAPAAIRKSGGLAVRETRRLAKVLSASEDEARLWIELCDAAGLVGVKATTQAAHLLPTPVYDRWLTWAPADRMAPVVAAWTRLADIPTWWPDNGETPVALAEVRDREAAGLRSAVLRVLEELPRTDRECSGGVPIEELLMAARWRRPLCVTEDAVERVTATMAEAQLLGLVAHDALTPIGSAALRYADAGPGSDAEELAVLGQVLRESLPAPQETALFQADLTVVVTGAPAPALAELLNSTAERESDGHAVVWRIGPDSVRRALDAGTDASQLLERLAAVAHGPLPQPLEYLIKDTARKHGTIKVVRSACCVRSDDEALIMEISQHRSLRKLGLRRIAPTVVISAKPVAATLEALRTAGYAPALEAETGDTVVERAVQHRAPARKETLPGKKPDAALALARRLLKAG
ncbi:helicase-associated domain-containing protein [Kutzneria sp. NPDC052558]|uniref:helicase-associated domain-containing protein n=1 Tax=Kutzneria sp. NPDC052558 TaxID=3364121 RepID=UPI0037CCA446